MKASHIIRSLIVSFLVVVILPAFARADSSTVALPIIAKSAPSSSVGIAPTPEQVADMSAKLFNTYKQVCRNEIVVTSFYGHKGSAFTGVYAVEIESDDVNGDAYYLGYDYILSTYFVSVPGGNRWESFRDYLPSHDECARNLIAALGGHLETETGLIYWPQVGEPSSEPSNQ